MGNEKPSRRRNCSTSEHIEGETSEPAVPSQSAAEIASLIELQHGAWLKKFPRIVQKAALALATDSRMASIWGVEIDHDDFRTIVTEFHFALDRSLWDEMPQRERDLWIRDFDKTVDALIALLVTAPVSPEEFGFPFRDDNLIDLLGRLNVHLPVASPTNLDRARAIDRIEAALDAGGLTLVQAIRAFQQRQHFAHTETQPLKKPRDERAGEAYLIRRLTEEMYVSEEALATILAVLFGGKKERDERVLRKFKHKR